MNRNFGRKRRYTTSNIKASAVIKPLNTTSTALRLEISTDNDSVQQNVDLDIPDDVYGKEIYKKEHWNYIEVLSAQEHQIVSILQQPQNGSYIGLRTTKKGSARITISQDLVKQTNKSEGKSVQKYLNSLDESTKYYQVLEPSFKDDLLKVEQKHRQDNKKCVKIAVVYCEDQSVPKEMFGNKTGSAEFQQFLTILGDKINLEGWTKYKGDIKEGEAYYTKWGEFEVMFHVSVLMNSEMHRRLIGNDIAIIIFNQGGPFDSSHLDEFGTVPQIFSVVQPVGEGDNFEGFKLGFLSRVNIKEFGPKLTQHIFKPADLKNFLLTKIANGYIRAFSCPPMNRLFYVPRAATLEDLVDHYPALSEKKEKNLMKQEQRESISKDKFKQLLTAIGNQKVSEIKNLLKQDRSIAQRSTEEDGSTALHVAAWTNLESEDGGSSAEIVKLLLSKDADVNCRDKKQWTALHFAIQNKNYHIALELLRAEANADAVNSRGNGLLHFISKNSNSELALKVVNQLLTSGANINFQNEVGETCLHNAVLSGNFELVEKLIQQGGSVSIANTSGESALDLAKSLKDKKILKVVKKKYEENQNKGFKEYEEALQSLQIEKLKKLIKKDPSLPTQCNKSGETGAHIIAAMAYNDAGVEFGTPSLILEQLFNHSPPTELSAKDCQGWTCLHIAIQNCNYGIASLLCDVDQDVRKFISSANNRGNTALHFLAQNKKTAGTEGFLLKLIEHGVDLNAQNDAGETPLHYAVMVENEDLVEQFCRHGVSCSLMTKGSNETALSWAEKSGNNKIQQMLLTHKQNLRHAEDIIL